MTWTPTTVTVDRHELRVAQRGEGDIPLLLINGIGAHLDMWEPFERHLSDRHLIAFDLPGTGESPRTRWPRRMRGLADLVGGLLETLGVEQADVLGISFGGACAQEFAHRHPERIRKLVLCATSPGIVSMPPGPEPALYLLTPLRYVHPAFFNFMMPRIVGGRTARDPEVLRAQMSARLLHPPDPIGYLFQLYAASGWTSAHYLHRIRQPTLVLAGDDDRAIPLVNARLLHWLLPNSELQVVKDGGHAMLLDEPEKAASIVEEFLSREPDAPAPDGDLQVAAAAASA